MRFSVALIGPLGGISRGVFRGVPAGVSFQFAGEDAFAFLGRSTHNPRLEQPPVRSGPEVFPFLGIGEAWRAMA